MAELSVLEYSTPDTGNFPRDGRCVTEGFPITSALTTSLPIPFTLSFSITSGGFVHDAPMPLLAFASLRVSSLSS